jgi:trimeric autotransporter adhesin
MSADRVSSIRIRDPATGDGAVAIGDPDLPRGAGSEATGTTITAGRRGFVALGNQAVADHVGAVINGNP